MWRLYTRVVVSGLCLCRLSIWTLFFFFQAEDGIRDPLVTVVQTCALPIYMRRQLSIQKLLNREVVAKISITDQEVADFYNANKAQFNFAEPTYHLAQIVVTPRKDPQIRNHKNDDATNESEALRKTKMLMDRLNSGADFAQLAMDYSEDMNT